MIEKQRILITKFPFRSRMSGVEKHTFQIVEKFNNREIDFFLISSCPIMLSEFKKRGWCFRKGWLGWPPVNGLTKFIFFILWPLQSISAIVILLYYRFKFKINKLYCLTLTEKLIMTPFARLLGVKVLWFEHLSIDPVISRNIFKYIYRLWSGLSTIITISEHISRELKLLSVKNSQVIYHGVDFEKFKKQKNIFNAMTEKRFSFDPDKGNKYRIGCVSRLENLRGLEILLKATVTLAKEFNDIEVVIVGEGSERERLQWIIQQLKLSQVVRLVGYKDNFIDWVMDFDVFVLPSLRESMGLILLEALACKKPVVASRIGGIPEIIQEGVHGILVEPGNAKALAGAIFSLKKNPTLARSLAEAGYLKVKEKFYIDKMFDEYQKILMS